MEKLIIGLDICDTYTQMCCAGQEKVYHFPTVVCRRKDQDIWMVGQDAYASALMGDGVIVDKLLKLLRKEGTSTIAGVRYEGLDLMQKFLERVLAEAMGGDASLQAGSEPEADRTAADTGGNAAAGLEQEADRTAADMSGNAAAGLEQEAPQSAADRSGSIADGSEQETDRTAADISGSAAAGSEQETVRTAADISGSAAADSESGAARTEAGSRKAAEAEKVHGGAAAGGETLPPGVFSKQPPYDSGRVGQLIITVPKVGAKLLDQLISCTDRLQIPRERVHVISHTEAFLYYVLSQKREVWNNQVGMFDLSEDFLCYYEMKVQRGMRQVVVMAEREKLDEGFNLDILNTQSGIKLADKILCSCGERFLQRKLFSSVFLTGKGFESQDWAKDFMKLVCTRRKVYTDQALFVQGAAYKAADLEREKTAYPYVFICDGRLATTVAVKVLRRDQEELLVLAAAGDSWYEARGTMEFILDRQQFIEFVISPSDPKRRKLVRMTLEGFPERDDKTLRIRLQTEFLDENTMAVTVEDMGFGEFYPSTGAVMRQEVML